MENAPTEIRTIPRPCCLLCNREGRVLHDNLVDTLFGAPGVWRLKECVEAACGLVWLDPAPMEEDLPIAYQHYYTHDPAGNPGFMARLRDFLYAGYKLVKFVPSWLVGLSKSQERTRLMFIDDLKPGKILDVGCGDGAFLNLMRGRGWSVEGVDVDAKAVARAKAKYGLELRCSNLRAAGFPHDTFDAITLSHVIEHVPDPPGLLAEMARVLKPGGRLVATTPNIRSRGHKTFQRDWRGLEPPRHLNIFSLNALRECARRAGLEVVETTSTAANADIIAGGSFFIRHFNQRLDRNAPLPKINLVRALRSMLFQYAEFFSLRNDPHAGEEAVLICGKKPA